MKNYFLVLFMFFLIGCNFSRKQTNEKLVDTINVTQQQFDLIIEKTKEFPTKTQLSIAIIENGVPKFYGVERKNNTVNSIDNHENAFEIGSITKLFTATLLANFALENKLNLDDNINDYIEILVKGNKQLTFKQLSNHTSGLNRLPSNLDLVSNPSNPYKNYSEEKLEDYLSNKMFLSQKTGEKYQYSNFGAGLLGYVLCKIDSTDYESLLVKYVTSKYEMKNSTTNKSIVKDILVKGLDATGIETPNWDLASLVGAGGMVSTTEDLAKFAIAQFNESNKELKLTQTKTFQRNKISDIGLGWHIINRRLGATWLTHSGGTGGYTSSIILNTETRNGIVILSNVSAFHPKRSSIEDIAFDLMKNIDEEITE